MKNKGISLIVLIITIVVIIILATAIIVNIAQTNLIEKTNEAVVKQDFKTMQEELTLYIADKYADTYGKYDSSTLNAISAEDVAKIIPSIKNSKYAEYVVIKNGSIEVLDTMSDPEKMWAMEVLGNTSTTNEYLKAIVGVAVTTANATITGENPSYNNPVIPVGFKAVNTQKASWLDSDNDGVVDGWNNGLVLLDSNDNEYVWIPVDGTSVKYSKWNGSKNTDYTVTKEQVEDDTLPSGVSSETAQITKYGGFYVARYEAGLPDEQTTEELMLTKTFSSTDNNRTDIGKAQSKADKIVWNRIDYNNAKTVSENVIKTAHVQSGLITGTQWDTILTFLSSVVNVDSDSTDWGNCSNKYGYTINGYYRAEHGDVIYTNGEYTKSSTSHLLLQTGKFGSAVAEGSPKNLFDISGNVWEWTTEVISEQGGSNTQIGYKVLRGCGYYHYGSSTGAAYRFGSYSETTTYPHYGFRFVLYVK